MLSLSTLVVAACVVALSSGLISVREGWKNINERLPGYINMSVAEVKTKILANLPDVEFVEFEEDLTSEFYYGKVGLKVKDGMVVNPPHYFTSKKIVEDWTPYIGKPCEIVMEELQKKEGLDGVRFLMKFENQVKTFFDNRQYPIPFVMLTVNIHGDVQEPSEAPRDMPLNSMV